MTLPGTTLDRPAVEAPQEESLCQLAHDRLRAVLQQAETTTTLDAVMRRLFDRDHRELLTYSAFGSAL